MISWTRLVSRVASICIRPAKRWTASGSSEASITASESSESAPTGVFSSWLTLATKSRRTASIRRASVRSSTSSSTSREPSGATRAETARASPRPAPRRGRSSSTWRISPSRRVSRAICSIWSTASRAAADQPEGVRRRAGLDHGVALVQDDGGGAQHGQDGVHARAAAPASVCREVRVGRACSRSLQRNASTAITPVQQHRRSRGCGDCRVHVHASRLSGPDGHVHSHPSATSRTLVAQSSPWRQVTGSLRVRRTRTRTDHAAWQRGGHEASTASDARPQGTGEGHHAGRVPRGTRLDRRRPGRDGPAGRLGDRAGHHGPARRRPEARRERDRGRREGRRPPARPGGPGDRPAGPPAAGRHRPADRRHLACG